MCDPNDNTSDLILEHYGTMDTENKSLFSDSDMMSATGPSKSVLDLSIMGVRKRKAQDIFPYPKDYKVQRKSVEKIHLSVDSPSLNSTQPRHDSVFLTEDDDDTEKYLTNSSKKHKQSKKRKNENESNKSDQSEVQVFESSSVQVETDDYGDLVVTLYPTSDGGPTLRKDQNGEDPSQSSYLKEDQPATIYLSADYLNSDNNASIPTQSIQSSDEGVVYSLAPSPITATTQTTQRKTSPKSNTKAQKHNFSPGSVETVKDPVRNVWVTVKEHKEQLKQWGHTWTKGTWSNEEVQILKQNIETYCEKNNIKNVVDLIFTSDKETRKDFYPSLCNGLNRPLFAVYRRVKRMYDKRNYKGKYSEEEVNKLKELRKMYGHDWSVIGQELGRSSDSVKDRCRLIKDDLTTGRWTSMEESKLDFAVHAVTNTSLGESVTDGVSWPLVAEIVKTRTEKQCRTKWLNYLNWKRMQGDPWTKNDDKLLVAKISDTDVGAENEVDWSGMCGDWKSARSPQWLRLKWNGLKKLIPENEENFTFKETVTYLKNHFSTSNATRTWEKTKKPSSDRLKQIHGKQHKISAADLRALRSNGVHILSKEELEQDDSGNITTSVISQSEDTTSAPLFIQTNDPDHLVSQELLESSTNVGSPHDRFRLLTDANDGSNKPQFNESLICDGGGSQLPLGTYRITSTSSDGIYIIQAADTSSSDEVTLTTDDDRSINITLPSEVLNTMLKLDSSKLATDVTEVTSSCTGSDVAFDANVDSVYLTSSDIPVLGSVAHDVTIGSPGHNDSNSCCLQEELSPLAENLL